jgi:hypothetical protein
MKKKIRKHIFYYLSLLIIFSVGFFATVIVSPNLNYQKITISLTIISYVIWGIIHHYKNHELTTRIMIEYVLIGLLGLSIVFFLVEGGV